MPPSRVVIDRCAVCDGALRAAPRTVIRGVPLVHCPSCGHCQAEREPDPMPAHDQAPPPIDNRWAVFEKAARRLLALRTLGFEGGRLLDLGTGSAFAHIAAAGPFDVTNLASTASQDGSLLPLLAQLAPAQFRVATLWEGIAREPAPVALLETLRSRLQPGGMLALAAPVQDDPAALRRPPRGRDPLTAARHVFSRTSLRAAVQRAGFDVVALVPADLQPKNEGLRAHEQWVARASLSLLNNLARERRYATRFLPESLWRWAHSAELWAVRPS